MDRKPSRPPAGIGAVVFDFDGTLVRSNAIKRDTFFDVARHLPGAASALDAIFAGEHGDRADVFARLAKSLGAGAALARDLTENYTALCDDRIAAAPEVPGAAAALAALRQRGIPAWIASATPQAPLLMAVRRRGLLTDFAGVYGLPTTKIAALRLVAEKAGLPAERILMVGDAEADRAAAMAVGTRFVAVAGSIGGIGDFGAMPDHRLDDLRNLPDFIAGV